MTLNKAKEKKKMKTRSNMPLFVVETTDITNLTDGQIELLRCGDYLVKKTGNQEHAYKVTYKEEGQGICLSYFAAGYTETVSYDFTDGHWVYNSTDVVEIPTSTGTKLYKHYVSCQHSGTPSDNFVLIIISTSATPISYTVQYGTVKFLKDAKGIISFEFMKKTKDSKDYILTNFVASGDNAQPQGVELTSGAITNYEKQLMSIFSTDSVSDTVTEL